MTTVKTADLNLHHRFDGAKDAEAVRAAQMTLDHIVDTRVAFAARRRELLKDWLYSHEISGSALAHWAKRIQACNDAEIAFTNLVLGVR